MYRKKTDKDSEKINNLYLDVTYGKKPFTNYPYLHTKYLTEKFSIQKNSKLLDLGCGRGEFTKGFLDQGMDCYGVDQSDQAKKFCPAAKIKVANLEERLPFEDNCFDVIYSKSVLEHFYYPEKLLSEAYRVLKPNGLIISLTPDWAHNVICFHEDFTHRTAFTSKSLDDIHKFCNFTNVETNKFIQLPFVWRMPYLKPLTDLIRIIAPYKLKTYSKLVRFSKEIMLITTARK